MSPSTVAFPVLTDGTRRWSDSAESDLAAIHLPQRGFHPARSGGLLLFDLHMEVVGQGEEASLERPVVQDAQAQPIGNVSAGFRCVRTAGDMPADQECIVIDLAAGEAAAGWAAGTAALHLTRDPYLASFLISQEAILAGLRRVSPKKVEFSFVADRRLHQLLRLYWSEQPVWVEPAKFFRAHRELKNRSRTRP
jgi:hypothetical protein